MAQKCLTFCTQSFFGYEKAIGQGHMFEKFNQWIIFESLRVTTRQSYFILETTLMIFTKLYSLILRKDH